MRKTLFLGALLALLASGCKKKPPAVGAAIEGHRARASARLGLLTKIAALVETAPAVTKNWLNKPTPALKLCILGFKTSARMEIKGCNTRVVYLNRLKNPGGPLTNTLEDYRFYFGSPEWVSTSSTLLSRGSYRTRLDPSWKRPTRELIDLVFATLYATRYVFVVRHQSMVDHTLVADIFVYAIDGPRQLGQFSITVRGQLSSITRYEKDKRRGYVKVLTSGVQLLPRLVRAEFISQLLSLSYDPDHVRWRESFRRR